MMAMLDGEQKAIQSKRRGFRQVKIEENDSWLIRYIPYTFGPTNKFYLKVANHWIFRKPYFCPRETDPEAGGDPNYDCELCATCNDMRGSPTSAVKNAGFKGSATQQWLMYCFVYERELAKHRGEVEIIEDPEELWTPWEYWHSQWGFDEFISIFRKNYNDRRHPSNVLDFMTGSNFWARGTTKGVSLQKHDSGPITEGTPEQIQEIINFAWSKIRVPTLTPLNDEQTQAALIKLEELAREAPKQDPRGRRTTNFRERSSDDDAGDLAPQRPPAVARAPQVSAPQVSAPRQAPPAVTQAQVAPPRVSAPSAAPTVSAPRVSPPTVVVPKAANMPPSVSATPPALPTVSAPAQNQQPSLGDRLRARQSPAPAVGGNPNAASTIDPTEDNVTDEHRDPAPPNPNVQVDDNPPPQVSAEGIANNAQAAPVASQPPAGAPLVGRTNLSSKLRGAIANASNRR